MRASPLALLLACTVAGCGSEAREPAAAGNTEPPVEYSGPHGPEHWAELHEEWRACGEGHQQSPVELSGAVPGEQGALAFDYSPAGVAAADTGRSIGFTPVANDALRIGGRPVGTLKQVHFHAPSEHRVGGRAYAMEFHLVHTTGDDRTTVVGVLVDEGAANSAIEPLSQDLPDGGEPPVIGELDPRKLLPADTSSVRYAGSLTTPPCTEGVDWVVLTTPITLSAAQLARFRRHYDGNNRPLQPLGDRRLVAVE
jgi:carbonic anhydrase